jgi:hypothetical protein
MTGTSPTKGSNAVTFASDKKGRLVVQVFNYAHTRAASFQLTLTGVVQPGAAATQPVQPAAQPTEAPAPAAVSGDGMTPETAIKLQDAVSGDMTGTVAGQFRYYTLDYAGDSRDVTLTIYFTPSDSTRTSGIGLHVWQPGGQKLASMTGVSDTKGTNRVTFFSGVKGPYLVQVFNYAPGLQTFFQVQVSRA